MLFQIRHSLSYRYGRPVFLEPMTVRLTPRRDVSQRVISHQFTVRQPASGAAEVIEPDGNDAWVLWFDDQRDQLELAVAMEVDTLRSNPFDWILTDAAQQRLPVVYSEAERLSLAGCLASAHGPIAAPVAEWAASLAEQVEGDTLAFLMELAATIHRDFHHIGRLDGDPLTASETLASRQGACRDTAILYVEACRSLGLAARFVSGYSMHHPPEVTEHELHAWAEVYLSGGGWRGYDPSLGLAVADGHLVLAAAPDHRLAAAVSGSYRGTGVSSELNYAIDLQVRKRT
ncbi:MAG: transglutaminase family protein [Cyanobacteria bacterium]|nr:transglutaminase family protein [Cyanobacteriota bacterium]